MPQGSTAAVDVLIVGAGLAGAAAACVLAERHSVMLVDRHATPPLRIGESLIGAAKPLLRDLGVLRQFEAQGHRPGLGQASSWGTAELVRRDSFLDPRGSGWRIDRLKMETMLRDAAVARGAHLRAPAKLARAAHADGGRGWRVQLATVEGLQHVQARFVIDASGRAAAFARAAADVRIIPGDALVCSFVHLPPQLSCNDLAGFSLVEAVADGWWYRAELPDGSHLLAFHTDADLPAARCARNAEGFCELLGATRWIDDAAFVADVPVQRVSARSQWLADPCGVDWCAVGDAALSFDPLSSQGLFNALYSGLRGAEAIAASLAGDPSRLAAYRERLARIRDAYRRNLADYYTMESRFADRLFWQRRHAHVQTRMRVAVK